ncbi:MAG: DUF2203 family protein [Planctomycetota bacterium]|jgi:hypothetical protein
MPPRIFTPSEANRTLPLVRRIVEDILKRGAELRKLRDLGRPSQEQDDRLAEIAHEIQDLLHELKSIGCEYKDWGFDQGLVDFPSIINGEMVYLCWRSDESELGWYHGLHSGYAGRLRIPLELLKQEAELET